MQIIIKAGSGWTCWTSLLELEHLFQASGDKDRRLFSSLPQAPEPLQIEVTAFMCRILPAVSPSLGREGREQWEEGDKLFSLCEMSGTVLGAVRTFRWIYTTTLTRKYFINDAMQNFRAQTLGPDCWGLNHHFAPLSSMRPHSASVSPFVKWG